MLTQTADSKTGETLSYLYDVYGNTVKTTSIKTVDDETTVGVTDCTYDITGNLLTSVSGDETSSYIYDRAGRTLLANEKGECTRTLYDNLGRTVQEIAPEDYDSEKDGLPEENTYADSTAGQTYVYAANGTLTSETNRLGQTTRYYYNDIGSKVREEFDIYKFYYLNHGELYQVKVANVTTVSYNYDNDFKLVSENYANDDTIRYTYNDNGDVTAQYHNSNANPYVTYTYNEDNELTQKVNTDTGLKYVYDGDNVSVYKTSDNTLVQSYTSTETEADEETGTEAYTTVTENHFGTAYTSVSREKSVSYTAGDNTVEYSYQTTGGDEDEKVSSDAVKNGDTTVLSASYTYDNNGNVLSKSYGENNSIVNTYDDKDRITSTSYTGKTYNYTYDTYSQLTGVTGNNYTASYAYDSRGNITSKTVNDDTTTFTYANSGWKDLLVSVNGTELTYDANGNVLTYGDREYTWNTGRNLASITDGTNTYSYTYDENGIRTSKTINGVTTYYNTKDGVILSQTDGTNTMYFQYDSNGTPLGFVWNGTQYLYMTNQMGDVVLITDAQGNELVQYEYDEWGAVVSVTAIHDRDIESELANVNPLRYRGYYYDNETGYYYIQSRYYDTSICRFINSDVSEIANISKDFFVGVNSYAYCNNNPINNIDDNGMVTLANVIGAIVGAIVGAVGGYFLSRWLADKIGLKGKKRTIFIAGLTAVITASAAVIGYFIGPYVKKIGTKIVNALRGLVKSSGCFVAGTLISTTDGFTPIENIKVGDKVLTENIETGEIVESSVSRLFIHQTNTLYHIFTDSEEIITTSEHPFYVESIGWVRAKNISAGDKLVTGSNDVTNVCEIYSETLEKPINVYNFEVATYHNYFVGNTAILVHNTCIKDFVKSPKKFREVEKVLNENGFYRFSQNGSHVKFKCSVTGKTVTVPNHGGKTVAKGTLKAIFKEIGLL